MGKMIKKTENKNYIAYANEVFDYFKRMGPKPGKGGPYIKWLDGKRDPSILLHNKFLKHTAKNLILTGYLDFKKPIMFFLTDRGYDYTQGGSLLCNSTDLTLFVDKELDANQQFNQLWEIIGDEKTALFYVDGPNYYEVAYTFTTSLPAGYTTYYKSLDKSRTSRRVWFRELFLAIDKESRHRFLQSLSIRIQEMYEEFYPSHQDGLDKLDELEELIEKKTTPIEIDNIEQPKAMNQEKNVKLFISHSSGDIKVVEALVDLLIILGINKPEQMFCSSCPPFDVKVNDDIFETIKDQYHKYRLFMIYMLSDNYYNSPVSLNEMGAGWVLQYDYQCITLPGFSPKDIKGCVNPNQKALVLDSNHLKADLNTFKEKISKIMKLETIDQNLWEMKRDRFVDTVTQYSQNNSN